MNNSTTTQNRLMRTYEVRLTAPNEDPIVERVNLSYKLNDDLDAVDADGTPVDAMSVPARIEVMKRLRRLAQRSVTHVKPNEIEERDWDVSMVRATFVQVAVDQTGRPIPRQRRSDG